MMVGFLRQYESRYTLMNSLSMNVGRCRLSIARSVQENPSEQEEEAREFSLSKHSGAFKSGSIFQCFPGATSTELMTSIGKHTVKNLP
jgi:hypothetical protein